jgi:uncharacterized protein
VRELHLAINKTLAHDVLLFVNDKNVVLAAREAAMLSRKAVRVLATANVVEGIAGLFALRGSLYGRLPGPDEILRAASRVRSARLFFAGKDVRIGGVTAMNGKLAATYAGKLYTADSLSETAAVVLRAMGCRSGELVTVYYGGIQKEKDAHRLSEDLALGFPSADVEYYYGGMKSAEYWISLDE